MEFFFYFIRKVCILMVIFGKFSFFWKTGKLKNGSLQESV
jgi:hypothetical protein